jgi:hypothetical protein
MPKIPDSQRALITQLLAADEELSHAARRLTLKSMAVMEDVLERGDPAAKLAMAKQFASVVTNALTDGADDEGVGGLRDEMHAMVAEMRGEIMGHEDDGEPRVIRAKRLK